MYFNFTEILEKINYFNITFFFKCTRKWSIVLRNIVRDVAETIKRIYEGKVYILRYACEADAK